jgi:hypothetical protein
LAFNLNNFKADGLKFGGARPSEFDVAIFPPFSTVESSRSVLFVTAASLPGFNLGQTVVPYFGNSIKFDGDRSYDNFDVTINNDEDFAIRAMLERWSNHINALVSNRMDPTFWPTAYKGSAEVTQYGKDGRVLRVYRMIGLWPATITPIQLDWSMQNMIETYQVSFSVDYIEPIAQNSSADQYNVILPDEPNQGNISGNPASTPGTFTA